MISRLPSSAAGASLLADLNRSHTRLARIQDHISSGKQVQRPSDDPLATGRALDLRSTIRRGEQLTSSIADGGSWLKLGDTTLTSARDVIIRARTLLLQAANSTIDPTSRDAVANDLEGARETLLDLANTTLGGRPIFAGTSDSPLAYDTSGTYVGDTGTVSRTIGEGRTVGVAVPGPDAFGTVFDDLTAAITAVRNGDQAGIDAGITALDASSTHLAEAQVVLGARSVQVEEAGVRNEVFVENLRSELAEVEDIDLTKAIIDLKAQEAAYEAALAVTAKAVQPSLLDFLR